MQSHLTLAKKNKHELIIILAEDALEEPWLWLHRQLADFNI
jgi:hypothetical protein